MWAFSSCGEQELLLVAVPRASHCSGFSCCRAQASANPKLSIQPLLLLFPLPVQFSSVTQLCSTLCNPMDCSITNSWNMLKLKCIKSVMPSNHLILCRPLLLLLSIFPSIRVFSNESVLHIRWPKYWQSIPLTTTSLFSMSLILFGEPLCLLKSYTNKFMIQ